MTRSKLALAGFLLLAATVIWTGAAPLTPSPDSRFGTDVQIAPSGKSQGGFSIRVKVTDLSSGAVVAAPHLIIPSGEAGEAKSELPDQSTVVVSAKADSAGHTANYSIAMKKGDLMISSHTASVNLQ
jgi:hypothetical protein